MGMHQAVHLIKIEKEKPSLAFHMAQDT